MNRFRRQAVKLAALITLTYKTVSFYKLQMVLVPFF